MDLEETSVFPLLTAQACRLQNRALKSLRSQRQRIVPQNTAKLAETSDPSLVWQVQGQLPVPVGVVVGRDRLLLRVVTLICWTSESEVAIKQAAKVNWLFQSYCSTVISLYRGPTLLLQQSQRQKRPQKPCSCFCHISLPFTVPNVRTVTHLQYHNDFSLFFQSCFRLFSAGASFCGAELGRTHSCSKRGHFPVKEKAQHVQPDFECVCLWIIYFFGTRASQFGGVLDRRRLRRLTNDLAA